MARQVYACYSVDASVMIRLKDMLPDDLFRPAWEEIERLVVAERWKVFDHVAQEVHGERAKEWFSHNPAAIAPFDASFNDYFNRFMVELDGYGLRMVDPNKERDDGDPFVVALALLLEGRSLGDLRTRTTGKVCCVLTSEVLKRNKVNIPSVCAHYSLPYMTLFDFMRHHGWEIALNVRHPD